MNIVFYLLVIIALVGLWFVLTGMFTPLGKYMYKLYKDTKDVMTEEDKEDIKEEEKEN
jgi:hypothetical protein